MRIRIPRLRLAGHRPGAHHMEPGLRDAVRFPVYSVLIEHDEGLFLFDSGYDSSW